MTASVHKMLKILILATAMYHSRCRQRQLAAEQAIVKARMDKRARNAKATLASLAAMAAEQKERRVVPRCLGKWRGSSVAGYLRGPPTGRDEITYRDNFRMSIGAFDKLVSLMENTAFRANLPSATVEVLRQQAHLRRGKRGGPTSLATMVLDHPTTRFKVAACLYTMGQGGPIKPSADACGVGKSTLRKWLGAFAKAIASDLKPLFMPGKPWTPSELKSIQDAFASRRGGPRRLRHRVLVVFVLDERVGRGAAVPIDLVEHLLGGDAGILDSPLSHLGPLPELEKLRPIPTAGGRERHQETCKMCKMAQAT